MSLGASTPASSQAVGSRKKVPECGYVVRLRACFDPARLPRNHRHTNATFVKFSLASPQLSAGIEKALIPTTLAHGSILAGENDERILGNSKSIEFRKHLTDRVVEIRDHAGVGRFGIFFRPVVTAGEGDLFKPSEERSSPLVGNVQVSMRLLQRKMQIDRAVPMVLYEPQRIVQKQVDGVLPAFSPLIVSKVLLLAVSPERFWKIAVRCAMADEAQKMVEALLIGQIVEVAVPRKSALADQGSAISSIA